MAIRSSEYFTFNSIRSDTYGIFNVNISSGMQSEPFASNRSIREQKVKGNPRPFFMGIEREPFEFTLSFAFKDNWDEDKIREVARWLLSPKYYAPLMFAEQLDRIFYCLCVDSPELVHNCLSEGYINLKFRCIDDCAYTPVYEKIIDLSTNPPEGTIYTFENIGDDNCKPWVEIQKVNGSGDISISNQSNGNAEMKFVGLANNETITVDCENRIITSDIPLTNRYGNMQGDYMDLPIYNNYLLIKGKCKLKFKYQLKRLQ